MLKKIQVCKMKMKKIKLFFVFEDDKKEKYNSLILV